MAGLFLGILWHYSDPAGTDSFASCQQKRSVCPGLLGCDLWAEAGLTRTLGHCLYQLECLCPDSVLKVSEFWIISSARNWSGS